MKRNTGRSFFEIGSTWAVLAVLLALAIQTTSLPLRILLFFVIAARQYALLILNHEAFHGLLATSPKVNDRMARFLLSFPLGSVFDVSRKKHLAHHRLLGKKEDPDFVWYEPGRLDGLGDLARFVMALPTRQVTYTYARKSNEAPIKRGSLFWVMSYQILFVLALGPQYYILFWVGPLFVAVFLDKVRSFCEHASALPAASVPVVRSFLSNPVEKFFLSPFNMNYHAEHHRFPNVPHYRLAELSSQMEERENNTHYRMETSYLLSLWRHVRRERSRA